MSGAHKFLCERIQCSGFLPEEHLTPADAKQIEKDFLANDEQM